MGGVWSPVQGRSGAHDSWAQQFSRLDLSAQGFDLVRDRAQIPDSGDALCDDQWQGSLVAKISQMGVEI